MKQLLFLLLVYLILPQVSYAQDFTGANAEAADNIGNETGTLNGVLTSDAAVDVKYQFRYGTSTGSYSIVVPFAVVNVDGSLDVDETVSALSPATEYFYVLYGEEDADGTPSFMSSEETFFTLANEPSSSVSDFDLNSRTNNSANFNFTSYDFSIDGGNGGYVLYKNNGSSSISLTNLENAVEPDGQLAALSNNDVWESDEAADNMTFSGLAEASQYTMTLVSYNSDGSTEGTISYRKSDPPSTTFWTLADPPDSKVDGSSFSESNITTNSTDIDWDNVGNTDNYLVMYSETGGDLDINDVEDGITPAVLALNFPAGVEYAVSSSSDISLSGLQANTEYSYIAIPYSEGADPSTINYVTQSGPDVGTFTTDCDPPDAQTTFDPISASDINSLDITVNWDNTITGADRYLVVVKRNSAVAFEPVIGTSYLGDVNSNFSAGDDLANGGGTNIAVYDGTGSNVTVTGLDISTTYHFAVFAYNSDGHCYITPNAPGIASAQTEGVSSNNTISFNSAAATISSVDHDDTGGSFITVLDFDVDEGGSDGVDTNIDFITFSRGASDYFNTENIDWDEVIAEAQLENMSNNETLDGVINANTITIDIPNPLNDDPTEIGFVGEGSSVNFQLQIKLKESITAADIDNKNLVFELHPADFDAELNSSQFNDGSSSISSGASNNLITVDATDFSFIEPATTVDINATEHFTTLPQIEVTDENGNKDLDYAGTYSISNAGGITMANLPAAFVDGLLSFPNNFNYQGSGNGTLEIEDDTDLFLANSNTITVNPKVTFADVSTVFNNTILEAGELNEVVMGIELTALSNALLEELIIDVDQSLTGIVSNIRLFSSSDDVFDGGDSEVTVGTIDNGANTITFSSLSEAISGTASYYFVVVEVDENVSAADPNLIFTLDESNFSFSASALVVTNTIVEEYSFEDNIAPEVLSISVQPASLADADVGPETFQIIIEYNEEMDTDPLKEPTITFPTEDPTSSLSFSATNSEWNGAGLIYTAYYNFTDEGETIKDIDVSVTAAEDISSNTQLAKLEADLFSLDTENPVATPAINRSLVNQPNNTITLTATFNEVMDTGQEPTVTISDDTNFNTGSGSWDSNLQYSFTFTHNGNEELIEDAFITISNAVDTAGNSIANTNSAFFDISTVRSKIEAITATNTSGTYKEGDGPILITIDFDENITIGGTANPQLTLNSDGAALATYSSHLNDKITFSYTIADGDNADPLEVLSLDLNGATISNSANNPADLGFQGNALSDDKTIVIDTESPEIVDITSSTSDGIYGPGEEINIKVIFSENIQQTGTAPTLTLNTGATASFENITNGNELNFTYTIGAINSGENTNDLSVSSISASQNEILDIVGNASDLTLDATNNNLASNKGIEIDTDPPALDGNPFSPANGSLNVSQTATFSITLNEPVVGAGTANIKLVDALSGNTLATFDGATAFSNSSAPTLNFNSLAASLLDSTEYYFEFDAGAITDISGNSLAAFTGTSNWSFTTFGPARIDNFSVAACVDELFTIEGQYFTGVSEILTDVESGSPFEITTFSVDDDNTITFTVPSGTVPGKITLNKINGQDGNTDDATTTSETAIKVGPSSGEIKLVAMGTDVVCNVPGSDPAPVETSIQFDIVGGSGVYTVEFTDGVSTFTEPSYSSGDAIQVNPPADGLNTYAIVSITDEDPDLSSCVVTDVSKFTDLNITEFEQSEVEAGGTIDTDLGVSTVSVCLAEDDQIDLSDGSLMGVIPSIDGDITDGEWTIADGPNSGGGGFSSNFSVKTSTDLAPVYYPSLADASYGSVTLRLTSDNPTAPNPCSRDFDEITIVFVNTVSINVGPDLNTCVETDELGTKTAIQALNATLGGGAAGLEWSRQDNTAEAGSHDGSWGFAATANAASFTLTSTLEEPFYKASPQEIVNGIATLNAETTGGGCGGGTPATRQLKINISELPSPLRSLDPTEVCSGEEGVRYRMTPSSTQNTFQWTLSNEGPDDPGQNNKNQIDGLKTGNILLINFREVTSETADTLIVQEINPNTGCSSIADSIFITLKPKPSANITYTGNTTVSKGDSRILLTGEGGQVGNIQAGGVFVGPGIVQDQAGDYYLDPSILSVTDISDPADDIIIEFLYTDEFTCSASEFIRFNIYAENSSFQDLKAEYCVTDESDTIFVTPSITGADFEVIGISGPGITEIGLENALVEGSTIQVFKAVFNPAEAYEQNQAALDPSEVNISFTTREIGNPANVSTTNNAQTVKANPLPQLEFEGPEYDFCTYDEAIELTATGSNSLNTYSFTLLTDSLPSGLLSGNSTTGFEFNPAPLDEYLNNIGEESIEIFMEYSYTNASGCSAADSLSFFVYKRPDQPQLENENLCNVNGIIEQAVITNYDGTNPEQELQWYNNSDLSGDPIAFGETFTPSSDFFATNKEVTFYVTRRNLRSSGEDDQLCRSTAAAITYRVIGKPEVTWNKSSFGSEPVVFTASHSESNVESYLWEISRITSSGLESVISETITDLGNQELRVDFESLGAGQYQLDFTINTLFRCNTSVSHQIIILPEAISTSNYSFDFEDSDGSWVASIDNNNSWEWNVPSNSSKIQTEGSFWITNANGSYNPGEQSYLYSPVLNLSQIDKPVVNFDLWIDVIDDIDGLVLEYSTDNLIIEDPNKKWELLGNFDDGISSGVNWYESTGIRSRPGTDNVSSEGIVNNNIFNQGWSKEAGESATKLEAKHALSSIKPSDRSSVIFRFQFKSNSTGLLPDGVAFDNFSIESLNRNVLVEYFGDNSEANDGQEMDSLASVSETLASMSWINYRIDEEDPLFELNATAMLSRIYQYDAYNASNRFAIDGVMKTEYTFSTSAGLNDLNNSLLVPSIVDLKMDVTKIADDQLSVTVDYSSSMQMPENARLFIAVLQKEITSEDLGGNSGKVYYNVLRKLLPDVEGIDISGNSTGEFESTFKAMRPSDSDELVFVSFIQDVESGEIYQSAKLTEVPNLSFSKVTANNTLEEMGIQLFPNPAKDKLNLSFGTKLAKEIELKVFDVTGKVLEEVKLEQGSFQYELNTKRFKTGIYNLLITNSEGEHKMLKFAVSN